MTEPVSGPGHGHDYVQITLGQSPSPHPPDPAHAEQGPEKYKPALLLSLVFGIYLIYDLIIPRSLVENGIKSIILLVLSSLELITENRELEDSLKMPLLMCPLSSHSLNRRLSRILRLLQATSTTARSRPMLNNNNGSNSNSPTWMTCPRIR